MMQLAVDAAIKPARVDRVVSDKIRFRVEKCVSHSELLSPLLVTTKRQHLCHHCEQGGLLPIWQHVLSKCSPSNKLGLIGQYALVAEEVTELRAKTHAILRGRLSAESEAGLGDYKFRT